MDTKSIMREFLEYLKGVYSERLSDEILDEAIECGDSDDLIVMYTFDSILDDFDEWLSMKHIRSKDFIAARFPKLHVDKIDIRDGLELVFNEDIYDEMKGFILDRVHAYKAGIGK